MKAFKILCIAAAILFFFLFTQLFFFIEYFYGDLSIPVTQNIGILSRRTSMFMLGFAVLLFLIRNVSDIQTRKAIGIALGITFLGLASLGTFEFLKGTLNSSILQAVIIECILGIAFIVQIFLNDKSKSFENQ